jgi:hypothetical protein
MTSLKRHIKTSLLAGRNTKVISLVAEYVTPSRGLSVLKPMSVSEALSHSKCLPYGQWRSQEYFSWGGLRQEFFWGGGFNKFS